MFALTHDSDLFDPIAHLNLIHHVLTFEDSAEHRLPAVEPECWYMGDKELAAPGIGSGAGHGQTTAKMLSVRLGGTDLIIDGVTRPVGKAIGRG